ncbi:hypothetical protein [Aquimarina megaterium]|uniref:hypothetical protein n=1 Tax=Aquimarina megaterium TaxID=1443666 RepID=UPI000472F1AE|nr:hypothetical protein [Aquimarina megaterium]
MNEETLIAQKNKLINLLNEMDDANSIKKSIHFYSLLNITDMLTNMKNKKRPKELRQQIFDYYELIFNKNLEFNKFESIENYTKFIFPSGKYMIYNYGFKSTHGLYNFIILGVILDIILVGWSEFWLFGYPIPIFTCILIFLGLYRRYHAKKKKKYFAGNY